MIRWLLAPLWGPLLVAAFVVEQREMRRVLAEATDRAIAKGVRG